jgi:uncharacterized protein YlxW (UPF0749 family)
VTATEYPTFRGILTEQQLADGIATEGRRLASERNAAREALNVERADHADTKTELYRARAENARLARQVEDLERQLDQARQQ